MQALPARAKSAYFNTVSAASLVENELNSMTDQILNAQDPDSIASRCGVQQLPDIFHSLLQKVLLIAVAIKLLYKRNPFGRLPKTITLTL